VRTELFQPLVIPSLAHHPVKANRQFARQGHLGDFPSPPHRQVDILAAPFREAARRRHLLEFVFSRRFGFGLQPPRQPTVDDLLNIFVVDESVVFDLIVCFSLYFGQEYTCLAHLEEIR